MPQYQTGTLGNDSLTGTWWNDIIFGVDGDDVIYGDRGTDILFGDDGNDHLWGGLGSDQLFGGLGFDTAVYESSYAGIIVNLGIITQMGGEASGDQFYSIEGVVGSRFDDILTGNAQANTFRGGAGADHIDGAGGIDKATYAYSSAAVDVDLTRAVQIGGDAAGDTLANIENLTGSDHADRLAGNDQRNDFSGGQGADYIDGRGGRDFVDYRGSTGVDIDLGRAVQIGGHAQGDQLVSIENVRGSTANDHIVGTSGGNELIGDAGDDYLDGAGGNDLLKGMAGDDTIATRSQGFADGGDGFDTLMIQFDDRDPFDGVQMYVDNAGALSSRYYSDYDPPAGYNLGAVNFERVIATGTSWSDSLMGTKGGDVLRGAGGDDYVLGGVGDDLDGGDGRDMVELRYTPYDPTPINVSLLEGHATGVLGLANFEDLSVTTGSGADVIVGGHELNYVNSQAGDDVVVFFGHHNYADLNSGETDDFDTYTGSGTGVDQVFVGARGNVDGGAGNEDTVGIRLYGDQDVWLDAQAGTSSTGLSFVNFETVNVFRENAHGNDTIQLGAGHDSAYASGGDDFVVGRGGNDVLHGGDGVDSLHGGDGDDILNGDQGHDDLSGGAGADRFYFSQGHDYIIDFNAAEGDFLMIPTDMQDETQDSFAELMASAEDTVGGLLLHSANDTGSTLLLAGLTKATFTENAVEFLV